MSVNNDAMNFTRITGVYINNVLYIDGKSRNGYVKHTESEYIKILETLKTDVWDEYNSYREILGYK